MVTQERLHELFEYREDGNLVRKVSIKGTRIGDIVGCVERDGYISVRVDGGKYKLHRLIFLYHHGYLTDGMDIDHIDCDNGNNRIGNLREVTRSQNNYNLRINSKNTSGIKGVCWAKRQKRWKTNIRVNNKQIHLGYYLTLEEAEKVMKEAREKYHGEYAREK